MLVPSSIKVKQGQPVKLVVTRKTDRPAPRIVIKDAINQKLPLNQPVAVEFTPKAAASLRLRMDAISGVIVRQ
jgi:plastocyanin domain-containing protein